MSRLGTVVEGIKTIASACVPVLRPYRVSYFRKSPHPSQPNMVVSKWTVGAQMGYNREDAAQKVEKHLRPGFNCYSTRISERSKDYISDWVQEAIETGEYVLRPEGE